MKFSVSRRSFPGNSKKVPKITPQIKTLALRNDHCTKNISTSWCLIGSSDTRGTTWTIFAVDLSTIAGSHTNWRFRESPRCTMILSPRHERGTIHTLEHDHGRRCSRSLNGFPAKILHKSDWGGYRSSVDIRWSGGAIAAERLFGK